MKSKKNKHQKRFFESLTGKILFFLVCGLLFSSMQIKASPHEQVVKGIVTDEVDIPLPGVSVTLKGTTTGTITDQDGAYTITVKNESSVLQFSYIGFDAQEIKVGKQTEINVKLAESMENLSEVVVVGYGVQKKTSLTASVGVIKGENLTDKPVANISTSLAGQVPGLITAQTSGEIGNDATSINIRGIATTGSSAPLIIVDGVPRNTLDKLDANTVESITVLKDAAAVAPYGMSGANGVILVTTKKGKAGKPQLSYSGYYGFQNPTRLLKMMNSYEYVTTKNAARYAQNPRLKPYFTDEEVEEYRKVVSGEMPASDMYANTNAYDELRNKNNPITKHNISITGGNDFLTAYIGLGYQYQEGMWSTSNANRYSAVVNLDAKVTKTTKIGLSINAWEEIIKKPTANGKDVFATATVYLPIDKMYYSNGLRGNSKGEIIDTESGKNKEDQTKIMTQLYLEQDLSFITKGLNVKGVINYDPTTIINKDWKEPKPSYYNLNKKTGEYDEVKSTDKYSLIQQHREWKEYTGQIMVNYNRSFGVHTVGGLFVFEPRKTQYKAFWANRINYDLPIDELDFGPSDSESKDNGGSSSETTQVGYVFRANYDYSGRYLLEFSGRYDGHYYFAPGKKYGFFPAVSLGWRLSEENFMKSTRNIIDNLKLRFSYGESGNLAGGPFQYSSAMGIYASAWGVDGKIFQGAKELIEPNPDITWERAKKTNIGVDATLWKGLLGLELDVFFEKRDNMLLSQNSLVPVEYAIALAQVNAGKMENKGIDFSITSHKQVTKDFSYNAAFNFTFARNKLLEIYENPLTKDDPNRNRTGRPINTPFGLKAERLFQADDFDENGKLKEGIPIQNAFSTPAPGDIKYVDVNGDGKITSEDETAIGRSMLPEIVYGINLGAKYRDFDLSVLFQGAGRNSIMLGAEITKPFAVGGNAAQAALDYWTPENTGAEFPRIFGDGGNLNNQQTSDWFVRSGKYIRMKNIEVGYTLPKSITKILTIESLRVFFSGQNLLTYAPDLKDLMDPEMGQSGGGDSNVRGWYVPQQKVVAFGLSINF